MQGLQRPKSLYSAISSCIQYWYTRSTYLINKILTMVITQLLGPNNPMQISLHEFLYEIDLLEAVEVRRAEDIEDRDDVFMVEMAEELDLAEGAKTEHGVVKGGYTFDSYAALGGDMSC